MIWLCWLELRDDFPAEESIPYPPVYFAKTSSIPLRLWAARTLGSVHWDRHQVAPSYWHECTNAHPRQYFPAQVNAHWDGEWYLVAHWLLSEPDHHRTHFKQLFVGFLQLTIQIANLLAQGFTLTMLTTFKTPQCQHDAQNNKTDPPAITGGVNQIKSTITYEPFRPILHRSGTCSDPPESVVCHHDCSHLG